MSISPVGSVANYAPQVRSEATVPARATASVTAGRDSDGDNDGSKGGTVDVRA
jgi:hypothetical protein